MNKDVKNLFREDAEPTVGSGGVYLPMWIVGLLGLLLYWGCNYVDARGGQYSEKVYAPYVSTKELASLNLKSVDTELEIGRANYKVVCMPCHQETGLGSAGLAPPLAGSEWVNTVGPNRLIRMVQTGVTGPIKVKDTEWNLVMPAMGATMDDRQLAAVLYYIRNSWGNKGSKVTADEVKKIRAELGGRTDAHTAEELLKLPDAL